eukprot:g71848.t1
MEEQGEREGTCSLGQSEWSLGKSSNRPGSSALSQSIQNRCPLCSLRPYDRAQYSGLWFRSMVFVTFSNPFASAISGKLGRDDIFPWHP